MKLKKKKKLERNQKMNEFDNMDDIKAIREFSTKFNEFTRLMLLKFLKNIKEKGIPNTDNVFDKDFLIFKLTEHFKSGNFADCANYCFLFYLHYGERKDKCHV